MDFIIIIIIVVVIIIIFIIVIIFIVTFVHVKYDMIYYIFPGRRTIINNVPRLASLQFEMASHCAMHWQSTPRSLVCAHVQRLSLSRAVHAPLNHLAEPAAN
jgi:hypothetical protein